MTKLHDSKTHSPNDFYRAFGNAVLCWQHIEAELFQFYFSIHDPGALEIAGMKFYECNSFGAKLTLVHQRAKTILSGDRLQGWRILKNEIKSKSSDRNVLAHLTAVGDFQPENSFGLALSPHVFTPAALIKTKKKYDAAECERLALAFRALAIKIAAFTAG